MNTGTTESTSGVADDGFSLVEIVVAMLVLALLAVAFLPILIQGIKQSAQTATLATATQLVHDQMEQTRSLSATCSTVTAFGSTTVPSVTDPRGVELSITRSAGACPTAYPGTVRIASSVTRVDTGAVVATASTLVYVRSS